MKKFLFEIVLFIFLPIICIASIAEYSIRQLPNDYSYKNQWMEENCQKLTTLCLGPSSCYYGIDPTYFNKKAFNGAHVSQSLNYDNFIFNKFINKMDSLQYVVVCIDYWSPFYSMEYAPEYWRIKNYNIYYGCDYKKGELKYKYELTFHNLSTFKNAAKGLLTATGLKQYSNSNVNELGYGLNYSSKNKKSDWDNGEFYAVKHNNAIKSVEQLNLINKNKEFVMDICKKCSDRNIKVLLISTPTYKSYQEYLNKDYLQNKNEFCVFFEQTYNNVSYIDYSNDKRFVAEDFYDSCHLNDIGARKLSMIINKKLTE